MLVLIMYLYSILLFWVKFNIRNVIQGCILDKEHSLMNYAAE